MHCPICAKPLEGGELVMVCTPCHQSLGGSGGAIAVGATGEFTVPSPAFLEAAGAGDVGERPATTGTCAWCGKLEVDVKKLLGRGGVALCNECVSLASDILDAELGTGWR